MSERPKTIANALGELFLDRLEPLNNLITWVFDEGTFIPTAKITAEERYSIVTDYLGTPCLMYNSSGNLVWKATLDIYGNIKKQEYGKASDCPLRYQGQYEDKETGLYYNRFRYYEPKQGKYISQDPIGLAGNNPNFYAYTFDSNTEVDVFGLDCNTKKFYSVQSKADAKRLKNGGTPWPNASHRAHFGEGVYAWSSKADAENYMKLMSKRTNDLEIVEIKINKTDFDSLNKLDMTKMTDDAANDWLSKHSSLYGDGLPHNFDYITRGTSMGQTEHFFSKNVYNLLSF